MDSQRLAMPSMIPYSLGYFCKPMYHYAVYATIDATQKASLDVMNMISHLISALFKHIAAQKDIIFRNEAVLDTILDFLLASSIDKLGKVTKS